MPLYGRDIKTRDALTYSEIVNKHHPTPETDQVGNIYFNGPDTIRRKTEYAQQSKLGGVMIWELGQDATANQSLLKVIRDVAGHKASVRSKLFETRGLLQRQIYWATMPKRTAPCSAPIQAQSASE